PALTSPYDYYQYWINVDDADVGRFLRLYTFLPEERIVELTSVSGAALREAKRVLAYETTSLTHGDSAAREAEAAARALFSRHVDVSTDALVVEMPTVEIPAAELAAGLSVADVFVRAGLCASKSEARRLAAQGGLSIDGVRIDDADRPFPLAGEAALLRVGKKRYKRLIVTGASD
ncbi:MAG: tyrosine--tRNA ligase, partial [Chloroflexota bacterium]